MQLRFLSPLVILLAGTSHAHAGKLVLKGDYIQGGMVVGRAEPPARVQLNGKMLKVGKSGLFVFGFGRNAKPKAMLRAIFPDGSIESRPLKIKKQKYRISRIDGLPKSKVTPSKLDMTRIRREYRMINRARARFTQTPWFIDGFIWPAIGRISGVYGSQRILNGKPRRPHYGLDVAAPRGTPVWAAAPGIIALAEPDFFFTGGTVIIDHGYGVNSVYSHLHTLHVMPGDKVKRGDLVAEIGTTGRSTGPHLDWRVNIFNTRLDPRRLVGQMPKKPPANAKKK